MLAFGIAAWQLLSKSDLSFTSVFETLLLTLIIAAVLGWVLSEDKRARSVELSEQGVSALVWARRPFPVLLGLERVLLKWDSVQRIGMRGAAIWIDDGHNQIAINTLLFTDPKEVVNFVNQCSKEHAALADASKGK